MKCGCSDGPIRDGEEVRVRSGGQEWVVRWHGAASVPNGRPHGSAGICVTPDGGVVLGSADGRRRGLPAGRPETGEDREQTLRREMLEEACAVVRTARLLGFSRGHCILGHEQGLVLVRAFWRADGELQPWEPRFETSHRRVVPAAEVLAELAAADPGHLPIYRRAMADAGLGRSEAGTPCASSSMRGGDGRVM